ncbi:ATP-binding protein [Sphingomonas sp. BK069]|uniref:ATP-binding protein n=1 Tax=Sphingomonas sp. BK069 TaxID=2586979 RepID=UPI00161DEBF1|nr:ATP-binding protein [Sphingomonas sp. BK069]MBB3348593.1 PAS domain S-box-containing protein [Sphingomonas sp. BK069]
MSAGTRPRPPSRRRFLLVAVLAPLLVAALIAWTDSEYARSLRLQSAAARSFDRERAQVMLLSAMKDAETAQRGYLLTGNAAFLGPYAPARRFVTRLRAVEGVADPEVAALIDTKFAELDRTLALSRAGRREAARAAVADGEGRRVMDRLRAALARAGVSERALTAERRAAFARQRSELRLLLLATGAMLTLALALTLRSLWRSRREAYDAALDAYEKGERNAAILRGTSDALLILNPSCTIEMINDAAGALLGYTPEELERRDVATVLRIAEGSGGFHGRIGLDDGRLDRPLLTDRVARHRDGSERHVDVAIGVMRVPSGDHLVLSLRDASERARVERAKDELISTIGHELRTPLTSVVGSLALLRGGAAADLPPQAARLVDIADNNARRLIRLINDLLDIDRIESGQLAMARTPLDLREVVARAALDSDGLARSRDVVLADASTGAPVPVEGDAERLLQVVTNLVSNAIHASPAGATVTIAARVEAGRALIAVEDRGEGVPAAVRPRLFERFESGRAATHAPASGLGLAISREIVRRHDGTIWFEDRDGGGTRFAFALPSPGTELGDAPASDAPLPLPLLLHLDDDPDVRDTVAAALAGVARVLPAASLAMARALLRDGAPDLALLDMQVVDGHGPELAPELVDASGAPVPVVIYSGQVVPPALAARAAVVLTKGRHDLPELVATVRRLLAERHAPVDA